MKTSAPDDHLEPAPVPLSPSNIDLLARLVRAEAQGEPYAGQVAVAAVIINRVRSPLFPDDVYSIVYQPGQFETVSSGRINEPAEEQHFRAVLDALAGTDPTRGALFFFNPSRTKNRYMHSLPVAARIGRHTFA